MIAGAKAEQMFDVVPTSCFRYRFIIALFALALAAIHNSSPAFAQVDPETRQKATIAAKIHRIADNLIYASDGMFIWTHGGCKEFPIYNVLLTRIDPLIPITETEHIRPLLRYSRAGDNDLVIRDRDADKGEIIKAILSYCPKGDYPQVFIEVKGFRFLDDGRGFVIPDEAYMGQDYPQSSAYIEFQNTSKFAINYIAYISLFRLNDSVLARMTRKPTKKFDDFLADVGQPYYVQTRSLKQILLGQAVSAGSISSTTTGNSSQGGKPLSSNPLSRDQVTYGAIALTIGLLAAAKHSSERCQGKLIDVQWVPKHGAGFGCPSGYVSTGSANSETISCWKYEDKCAR